MSKPFPFWSRWKWFNKFFKKAKRPYTKRDLRYWENVKEEKLKRSKQLQNKFENQPTLQEGLK